MPHAGGQRIRSAADHPDPGRPAVTGFRNPKSFRARFRSEIRIVSSPMDTITHGIVGALTGKALFAGHDVPAGSLKNSEGHALSSPTARAAIVACCLGSMFPDTDIFAGPLAHNPLAIMEWHRSITHSAVMLPLWALILAAVSIPLARRVKWKSP